MNMDNVLETVDKLKSWGIDVLSKLVSIPTVNPPGENYEQFIDVAKDILSEFGASVEVHRVPRDIVAKHYPDYADYPRYILLARIGSGDPVLQINGHYDVVPPGTGWTRDPFKPVVEDGRLYGRGAVDMKGGIAAAIIAMRAIAESDIELSGSLELALVPDEEIGGETGTGYLVERCLSRARRVIIAEPSGVGDVVIGHRGAVWALIEVYGRQAHGSTPWLGVNAFVYMARVVQRFVNEYIPEIEKRVSKYQYEDDRAAKPTVTLGGELRGGAKVNIVPGYCAFSIDRRLIVEEDPDTVEQELRSFIEKLQRDYPEVKLELRVLGKLRPSVVNPSSRFVKTVISAVKTVSGAEPRAVVCVGGLDMHFYTEKGIEAITYGPGPADTAHIADEYVDLGEMITVAKVYALTALRLSSTV